MDRGCSPSSAHCQRLLIHVGPTLTSTAQKAFCKRPVSALLALPGVEYVAYFPRGGANSIDLGAGSYRVEWLHPESGNYFQQPSITISAGEREFTPPRDPRHDWVLHLLKTGQK
jgi:hypothetical protein